MGKYLAVFLVIKQELCYNAVEKDFYFVGKEFCVMLWLYISLGVILCFLIASFAIVTFMFFGALRRKSQNGKSTVDTDSLLPEFDQYRDEVRACKKWFLDQEPENVTIRSHDGLTLRAWVLEAENPIATVLLMHGYRSRGLSDFSCVFPFYHKHGVNIVVPDQRACGESEGTFITLGVKERLDCKGWIEYINGRFGTELPIIMDGVSMGASTILMATALDLPQNVRGVIADCGFTSPWEVVCSVLKATKAIPVFPFAWFARPVSRIFAGFGLTEASATEAMKQCRIPVFFAHGKKDLFVPYEMSLKNFEACASDDKELFTVEEAGHGLCFMLERDAYEKKILEFLKKCGCENVPNQ